MILPKTIMAHAHRTGPGQGQRPRLGPGTMGFCITLCIVHTTQGKGQGQGPISNLPQKC